MECNPPLQTTQRTVVELIHGIENCRELVKVTAYFRFKSPRHHTQNGPGIDLLKAYINNGNGQAITLLTPVISPAQSAVICKKIQDQIENKRLLEA